jgi:hypothetical protein
VCARGARLAAAAGRSSSPLDVTPKRTAKFEVTVTFDASDFLLVTGAAAMFLHVTLCAIARFGLRGPDNRAIDEALFAVPNRRFGTPDLIRLLRFRYFFPGRALPDGADQLNPWIRAALLGARLSGLYFVCAILGFIAAQFLEAGS